VSARDDALPAASHPKCGLPRPALRHCHYRQLRL